MKAQGFNAFVVGALMSVMAVAAPLTGAAKLAAPPAVDQAKISQKLRQETSEKDGLRDRLNSISSAGAARGGESVDTNQVSVAGPVSKGALKLAPETAGGFAYIQPYGEPNSYEYRNYCGPGAATVLLSHWDPSLPGKIDIYQLGEDMNMDPDGGVWVRDILKPVNQRINQMAGQDLNWYQYGQANTLDEFRFMLDYDIAQNGVPLITSLQTGDLPGWGGQDVGHIIAVYGYSRDADGHEWVSYVDTASPASDYHGDALQTVDLGTFWQAVSQNSAQIW